MLRFMDADLVGEPRAYLYRVARNALHGQMLLAERERTTFDSSANGDIADGLTEADRGQRQ